MGSIPVGVTKQKSTAIQAVLFCLAAPTQDANTAVCRRQIRMGSHLGAEGTVSACEIPARRQRYSTVRAKFPSHGFAFATQRRACLQGHPQEAKIFAVGKIPVVKRAGMGSHLGAEGTVSACEAPARRQRYSTVRAKFPCPVLAPLTQFHYCNISAFQV